MKKMRMIGTVEVKSTVNLDDLLAALPEEEQVFMLLKAFLQFEPRNVREAIDIYLEQHPQE
jgi:hypothetical protein|nr:MAG TPA: hypothetical protein [Caudoviricetes sp.]